MNHWAFVGAAYGVTLVSSAIIAVMSWVAMRRAERAAEALRR
jgi:heme exporter protein D